MLKKKSDPNIFLIVSDHGMMAISDGTGDHSDYAFYSSDIELIQRPKEIIDYFAFILNSLKS